MIASAAYRQSLRERGLSDAVGLAQAFDPDFVLSSLIGEHESKHASTSSQRTLDMDTGSSAPAVSVGEADGQGLLVEDLIGLNSHHGHGSVVGR